MGFLEKLKRANKEKEATCEADSLERYKDTDVEFSTEDEVEEVLYGVFPDFE